MYLPDKDRINFEDFTAQHTDASHRKSVFDTHPDGLAEVNHRELL